MWIRSLAVAGLLLATIAVTGCAREANSLAELGCRTIDEYLPEFDAVHEGEAPTDELSDRITEELRLDYFDHETRGLFRLLAEESRDPFDAGYTPVDVDYQDIRTRAVDYCRVDIDWPLDSA